MRKSSGFWQAEFWYLDLAQMGDVGKYWKRADALQYAEDGARSRGVEGELRWDSATVGDTVEESRYLRLSSRTANGGWQDTGWRAGLIEVKGEVSVRVQDDARPESPWFGRNLPVSHIDDDGVVWAHVNGMAVG